MSYLQLDCFLATRTETFLGYLVSAQKNTEIRFSSEILSTIINFETNVRKLSLPIQLCMLEGTNPWKRRISIIQGLEGVKISATNEQLEL